MKTNQNDNQLSSDPELVKKQKTGEANRKIIASKIKSRDYENKPEKT